MNIRFQHLLCCALPVVLPYYAACATSGPTHEPSPATPQIRIPTPAHAAPLIYLDGLLISTAAPVEDPDYLSLELAAADITSVEILRGPAAIELYGTWAAAGMIDILTTNFSLPTVQDFPEGAITFPVQAAPQLARGLVQTLLEERRVRWVSHIEEPIVYLVTYPISEIHPTAARRYSRLFLMFTIAPRIELPQCSNVAVSWLWKSRGQHQKTWRIIDFETQDGPQLEFLDDLSARLQHNASDEGC